MTTRLPPIGILLKTVRSNQEKTILEMADYMGITIYHLNAIESGEAELTAEQAFKVADFISGFTLEQSHTLNELRKELYLSFTEN